MSLLAFSTYIPFWKHTGMMGPCFFFFCVCAFDYSSSYLAPLVLSAAYMQLIANCKLTKKKSVKTCEIPLILTRRMNA